MNIIPYRKKQKQNAIIKVVKIPFYRYPLSFVKDKPDGISFLLKIFGSQS